MRSARTRGFSFIDAAFVAAATGLAVAVALPILSHVRSVALADREKSAARLMHKAWQSYTHDNRDKCVPGAAEWSWVHGPPLPITPNSAMLRIKDPFVPDRILGGSIIKTWPLYLMSHVPMQPDQVQVDAATRDAFDDRSTQPSTSTGVDGSTEYGASTRHAAYAYHPSVGMNATFVGGSFPHGAFRGTPTTGANPRVSGGMFYVTGPSEARDASQLMVFCSSRGGDVLEAPSWWNFGQESPDSGTVRPGYWIVRPPKASPSNRGNPGVSYTLSGGWTANNSFNAAQTPSSWGMVSPRSNGAAMTAMVDGHVETQSLEQLRDMRKWSNYATSPNWNFIAGP